MPALRNVLSAFRSFKVSYCSKATNACVTIQLDASRSEANLDDFVKSYTQGIKSDKSLLPYVGLLSRVPIKIPYQRPSERERFVSIGANNYLSDIETLLKDQTKSVDLDLFCSIFYRFAKLDGIFQNRIVQKCGLERIVNVFKLIVERPEPITYE
uniref:Uncharacterized protein n=1 Tax=Romanomermis culicivorax TaxID=13658 RepID=A0A915HF36_ROMCU